MSEVGIKYIDYILDENGYLTKLSDEKIRETEHNIHRIRIYSSIEQTENTPYLVNIVLTRADGLQIGPKSMMYAQNTEGVWHRYYDLVGQITEVKGQLKFAISYEQWELNEENVLIQKKRYPSFVVTTYVYDANQSVYNEHYDLYQRLNVVEIKANEALEQSGTFLYSETEPVDMKQNAVWIKPVEVIEEE